ncbi:MAG: hypothetical protein QNJ22_16020 [Desulfosarcinaceae bacterium]|nr:hypothetical protein [Desulfosarcinaceae bacterium]
MAKIKKRKLCWQASASPQTIGYKLYWSQEGPVTYASTSEFLGQVTEIILPDGIPNFKPTTGSLEIGLTAVDELGNESDIATLTAPFHFMAPATPTGLKLKSVAKEVEDDNVLELKDKAVGPISSRSGSRDTSISTYRNDQHKAADKVLTDDDLTLSEEDLKL